MKAKVFKILSELEELHKLVEQVQNVTSNLSFVLHSSSWLGKYEHSFSLPSGFPGL